MSKPREPVRNQNNDGSQKQRRPPAQPDLPQQ
jgi:hypothetical protein